MARQAARIRRTLLRAVKADDLRGVVKALVRKAKRGDVPAARELLDKLLRVAEVSEWEELSARVERLEALPRPRG